MTPNYRPRRFELAAVLAVVLVGTSACMRPPAAVPKPAESAADLPEDQRLAWEDVEISLEILARDARGLPESIRVEYKNKSAERGYLELPGPVRDLQNDAQDDGQNDAENDWQSGAYRIPALCVETSVVGDRLGDGLVLLFSPPIEERPTKAVIAVLEPAATTAVKYHLCSFCMIGHGIGPEPQANFCTCYGAGTIKTEMVVDIITDWGNRGAIVRHLSKPVVVELSEPDDSKHSNFRHLDEPAADDEPAPQ